MDLAAALGDRMGHALADPAVTTSDHVRLTPAVYVQVASDEGFTGRLIAAPEHQNGGTDGK